MRHWVQTDNHATDGPRGILYPKHLFPINDSSAQEAYDTVVSAAENALGIERKEVDFRGLWRKYSSSFTTESYEEYFHTVSGSDLFGAISIANLHCPAVNGSLELGFLS